MTYNVVLVSGVQQSNSVIHIHMKLLLKITMLDFPGGTVVKNLPANAADTGSIPGPGRSHMLWSN